MPGIPSDPTTMMRYNAYSPRQVPGLAALKTKLLKHTNPEGNPKSALDNLADLSELIERKCNVVMLGAEAAAHTICAALGLTKTPVNLRYLQEAQAQVVAHEKMLWGSQGSHSSVTSPAAFEFQTGRFAAYTSATLLTTPTDALTTAASLTLGRIMPNQLSMALALLSPIKAASFAALHLLTRPLSNSLVSGSTQFTKGFFDGAQNAVLTQVAPHVGDKVLGVLADASPEAIRLIPNPEQIAATCLSTLPNLGVSGALIRLTMIPGAKGNSRQISPYPEGPFRMRFDLCDAGNNTHYAALAAKGVEGIPIVLMLTKPNSNSSSGFAAVSAFAPHQDLNQPITSAVIDNSIPYDTLPLLQNPTHEAQLVRIANVGLFWTERSAGGKSLLVAAGNNPIMTHAGSVLSCSHTTPAPQTTTPTPSHNKTNTGNHNNSWQIYVETIIPSAIALSLAGLGAKLGYNYVANRNNNHNHYDDFYNPQEDNTNDNPPEDTPDNDGESVV